MLSGLPDEDVAAIMNTPDIETAYHAVGKAFAKSIIDNAPIPSGWASDFMLSFLIQEEPDQVGTGKYFALYPWWRQLGLLVQCLTWHCSLVCAVARGPEVPAAHGSSHGAGLQLGAPVEARDVFEWAYGGPGAREGQRRSHHPRECGGGVQAVRAGKGRYSSSSSALAFTSPCIDIKGLHLQLVSLQIVRSRRWGLEAIRTGFMSGNTQVTTFLPLFKAGPQRRLLVVGEEDFNAEKVISLFDFREWDKKECEPYRQAFLLAVQELTDQQSQHFFRAATALNAIPRHDNEIYVVPKFSDVHPSFSTCTRTVFVPCTQSPHDLKPKLLEAINPECWRFQELGR